jgi:pilus assembly protein FimV
VALNREKIHQAVQRLVLKGQLDKAIQELRPILDEDPADTRTLQKVAELYRKKGAYQEAEGVYARLAEVFMRGGFFQRAVAVHNQILQINPTNLPVHVALGDTLTKLGLLQEANKIYARTVGLLQRAGRFDEATAILEKLIGTAPDNYQARLQLAELYLKAGRNDAAIKAFEEALPTLRAQGRDDLFQRAAERLLYYQPENLPLCRELSVFHLRRGNVPQAMKLLQYCHKRDPQDVDTLRLLASHFESAGDPDKAIVVLHQMARVFDERGDKTAAAETYRRILEARPQDPEAAKALGAGVPLPGPAPATAPAPSPPPSPPQRRALPPPAPPRPGPRIPAAARPGHVQAEAEAEVTSERVAAEDIQEVPSAVLRAEEVLGEATPSEEPPPVTETEVPAAPASPPAPVHVLAHAGGPELPPLPDEPSEVQKIAAEADIFVKFGLKDRSIGHLTGGLGQFPQSIVLRDRLVAIHLNDENLSSAVRVMLDAARVLAPGHPDHARRYAREVLFLDEESAAARELLTALDGRGSMPAAEPASASPVEVQEPGPAPVRPSAAPDVGADLDVDIDVASEPVRTIVISPHAVAPPPAPIPAAPAVPPPPAPIPAAPASPSRALVLDLPSFDDVETGPPLLSLAPPPPSDERLVVPVVLEMDEEDFDAELPSGLPAVDLPEADAEAAVDGGSDEGAPDAWESDGPIETGEVSASGLQTQSLPTSEHLPQPSSVIVGPSPVYPPVPADVVRATPPPPPSAAAPSAAAVTQGLEEVDFFFQQGLVDDARTLLEGLAGEHPGDPRIAKKLEELGGESPALAPAASGDALEALDSAFDALEAGGSGMRPMPGANDDEAVVTVSPADAVMHFDLGVAYREMGVLDRAVDEFKLAALDSTREASCHMLIGACLVGLGKPKEAVEALKKGLHAKKKTAQDEQDLYYGLAEAHLAAGDNKEALFYLQTIKRKDPDFRDVATKINALLSSTRPGRRPAHKPDGPGSTEPEPNIDQAFDDMFKEDHH